jgi:hypothetical protein
MPSRRATKIGFAAALAIGLCVLIAGAITTKSRLVNTVGVEPVYPVAPLRTGQEACQGPIGLADPVERLRFNVGTFGKPGPALSVTIRNRATGRVLGEGRVAAGWVDNGTAQDVPVGGVRAGQSVSACVRNLGRERAYLYGNYSMGRLGIGPIGVTPTSLTSSARLEGQEIPGDISLAFVSEHPRTLLSRLPSAFRHASVFRPAFVGAWTFWLLAALMLVAAPLALGRALSNATHDEDPEPDPARSLPSSPT